MTTSTESTPTHAHRPGLIVRSVIAVIVLILAIVSTPVAAIGSWGQRTLVDSEAYIATVGPLIHDPAVQDSIANAITDAVTAQLDTQTTVTSFIDKLLPNSGIAKSLAGPISAGVNNLVGDLVHKFVASPQFADAWIALNKTAQKGIVNILEGKDGGPIQLNGDNVVLDISSTMSGMQEYLVSKGVPLVGMITLPETSAQVVLLKAPGLAQIQAIYQLANPFLAWLPLIVGALFAIGIAVARRRAAWVIVAGACTIGWGFALIAAVNAGQTAFVNQLEGTVFGPASEVFYTTLLKYLVAGLQALIALGIVAVVFGFLGSRTRAARFLKAPVQRGLAQIGAYIPAPEVGAFVRKYRTALLWIAFVVVGGLLVNGGILDVTEVIWASLLAAGVVTLITIAASAGENRTELTSAQSS
mgnify:CR=1 FL=1